MFLFFLTFRLVSSFMTRCPMLVFILKGFINPRHSRGYKRGGKINMSGLSNASKAVVVNGLYLCSTSHVFQPFKALHQYLHPIHTCSYTDDRLLCKVPTAHQLKEITSRDITKITWLILWERYEVQHLA